LRKLADTEPKPRKSLCLKVPKQYGEKILALTSSLKIANGRMEIQRDQDFVYIPLFRKPSGDESRNLKEQAAACKISTHIFLERKKRESSIAEFLEDKLPPHVLAGLPHSADFVGDIAIIEVSPELDRYKNIVGEAILKTNKNVRTVLAKAGAVSGTYRVREFSVIAGEAKTDTIHKEYGCQYYVDVAKAYFSPRLSYEHSRVASLVREGETVIDLFAGVGPFAIQIAKIHERVKVYAVDANPYAIEYLIRNIRLNRVEEKAHPILGDARQVVNEELSGVTDRVIMNLPEKAIEFVDVACAALKPTGGTLHFYGFANASDSLDNVKVRFVEAVGKCGRKVDEILFFRRVRATAPYEWQIVLDASIH
jgi:tRNA (guanine37-N1)-methyltransferase